MTRVVERLRKRYFYKLLNNIVDLFVKFIIVTIIPRELGPKLYGDFNFLITVANQITGFADLGTSTGYFQKLSQRQKEADLVKFYAMYISLALALMIGFVVFAHATSLYKIIWKGQEPQYIYLAIIWGVLYWITQISISMADAYGLTVGSEKINIFQKFIAITYLLAIFIFGYINLKTVFLYYYLGFIICSLLITYLIWKCGYQILALSRMSITSVKKYALEFYHYCHPLIAMSVIGVLTAFIDRWLLQIYGGSAQQGFYGLSYQIGVISMVFTTAMTPLLFRELSISYGENNIAKVASDFNRYLPLLSSITAYFVCFIAIEAEEIINIVAGESYHDAVMTVSIMAFLPLARSYGQLSGSVFYAAGKTGLLRNITIIRMLAGLPLTFIMVAPEEIYGLNYGAVGLALKVVAITFIGINLQLYFNARMLDLSFFRIIAHQAGILILYLTLAFISDIAVHKLIGSDLNELFSFLLTGIIYSSIVFILVYSRPTIFGMQEGDIAKILSEIKLLNKNQ